MYDLIASARLLCLVRLLLLAMAVGALSLLGIYRNSEWFGLAPRYILVLLIAVMLVALLLVVLVSRRVRAWHLIAHILFDLCWVGGVVYLAGGVQGPAVPLLYAVVLSANLLVGGLPPLLIGALAALILGTSAMLYVAQITPYPQELLAANQRLIQPAQIIANVVVQTLGLFAIDVGAYLLARRVQDHRLLMGDLLDQMGQGVLAIDKRGLVLHCNEEAERLLRLPPLVPGLPLPPLWQQPLLQPFAALLRGHGLETETCEGPAGHHLLVRAGNLRGRRGRMVGRVLTVLDETALRQAEAEARRAEQLAQLGSMAAGIAHEVRNPLAALRGCAQELRDILGEQGCGDGQGLAEIIMSESDRLERIVSDFLRLSRSREPQPERIDLRAWLPPFIEQLRHAPQCATGCRLELSIAPDCPPLRCDPDHLRQALLNLVGNALAAVRAQGLATISVAARAQAQQVCIVVSDDGPGLDPRITPQLFTPFVSGHPQGTGLGLSLARRLLSENGGSLSVVNREPRGVEACITLPRA